jgi:hypothetical protein
MWKVYWAAKYYAMIYTLLVVTVPASWSSRAAFCELLVLVIDVPGRVFKRGMPIPSYISLQYIFHGVPDLS